MKSTLPKGLMVLSLITIVGGLSAINTVFKPDSRMIYAGQILQGLPFKIYCSMFGAADLVIGIGLLLHRRWSYLSFLALSAYYIFLAAINIILTDNDTLIHDGWKMVHGSFNYFRFIQIGMVCVVALMVLWLRRYRNEFRQDSANIHGLQRIADTEEK